MNATEQRTLVAGELVTIDASVRKWGGMKGTIVQRHSGVIARRRGDSDDGWLEQPRNRPCRDATGHYLVEVGDAVILVHEGELTTEWAA